MIHPSYHDLMQVVNSGVEEGEAPLINSRYSIVLATAKRARQIILGSKPLVEPKCNKPLSIAVQEVYEGKVKILPDDYTEEPAEEEKTEDTLLEAEAE
ncbi:MAG: DNA-directed RNA polymerase subunit omega [Lachnospiraceae bacterium]|nr:DNA-directed RNA polymerase subunit omega [Lachnospiraceae bacterium]